MIVRRDDAFKHICLIKTEGDRSTAIGTGIFVSSKKDEKSFYGWIVTASHIARETNENTKIIISTKDGKVKTLPLTLFGH